MKFVFSVCSIAFLESLSKEDDKEDDGQKSKDDEKETKFSFSETNEKSKLTLKRRTCNSLLIFS